MMLLALAVALVTAAPGPIFHEGTCADERIVNIARCGTIVVPEDRQRPDQRTIALNVIVLRATATKPNAPPLFDIDGGPGLPVTKNAEFYASFGGAYRAGRDIVLIDQRGTGSSNPLLCPELATPEAAYAPLYPAAAVRRCRKALEAKADLTKYGTGEAVADMDAVRAALGYDRIDLFGLSYGTTVALRYLATHPQRVRAAVLMGVSPASSTPPKNHAPAGDRAIRLLSAQCRADSACSATFDPLADIGRVRARLPKIQGAPPEEIFFEKLRSLMYQPAGARRVPLIMNRAAAGDLAPFYQATKPQGPSLYADGMFLSVICSESMRLMDVSAATKAAKATVFGDYRLKRQQDACAEWPSANVDPDYLRPVLSSASVLLISGELDPVTPPSLADEVARTLPNSRHVVIPGSGHILDGMSKVDTCLDPLILSFLESGDPKALDVSCVETMKPPAFATSVTPANTAKN
jgi:pimeloyl-ACP methyl ester carboxylesterase